MNILILGNSSDTHAAHVKNVLTKAGAIVDYLDTHLFPTRIRLSWQPGSQLGYLTLPTGRQLAFQDIHSVFWRSFSGVYVPALNDSSQQQIAYYDAISMLRTFIQACPARWVNSWQAYQFHKEKPLQLTKAKHTGIPIPATLVSNDPEQVIRFAQSYEKLIFKPVYGGAHARFLTQAYLEAKRLSLALSLSPITLQEYIPGTNIRTYVIGEAIYAAEIRTHALDFREDLQAKLISMELPESVQQQCIAITNTKLI